MNKMKFTSNKMKLHGLAGKIKWLVPALLFAAFFAACSIDDGNSSDNYYVGIATVSNPELSGFFIFTLDDSTKMSISATNVSNYKPATGQRIIANYTVLVQKPAGSSYDYDVRLNDAYNVLTKNIFKITPATQDSIGKDGIVVNSIWVGSDFLNVDFTYYGNGKTHYINLVSDNLKVYNDGKVHLEFRHNDNNDSQVTNYRGVVSFNLKSIRVNGADSVKMVIHSWDYSNQETTYPLTYKYGKSHSSGVAPAALKAAFFNALSK